MMAPPGLNSSLLWSWEPQFIFGKEQDLLESKNKTCVMKTKNFTLKKGIPLSPHKLVFPMTEMQDFHQTCLGHLLNASFSIRLKITSL